MPPSKLIVTSIFPSKGGFLIREVSCEGGRSNQKSFPMRRLCVPPSKLIVTFVFPPQGGGFLLGGFLIRGGDYIPIYRQATAAAVGLAQLPSGIGFASAGQGSPDKNNIYVIHVNA